MHKDSMGNMGVGLLGTWERKQLDLESDFENDLELMEKQLWYYARCSLVIEQRAKCLGFSAVI